MKLGDRISGFFWLVFSIVVAIESYRLDLGTFHSPQAGFLPFLGSIVLGILSLSLLFSTIRRRSDNPQESEDITFSRQTFPKVLSAVASLLVYGLLLNTLGFILCTMILIGFLLRAIEPQKWYIVIIMAISVPSVAYLLFAVFLKTQLPKGFLGF